MAITAVQATGPSSRTWPASVLHVLQEQKDELESCASATVCALCWAGISAMEGGTQLTRPWFGMRHLHRLAMVSSYA